MKCFFCKGDMADGTTTYFTDLGSCMIIIKKVPCLKCDQCGEIAYTGTVIKQLEKIIASMQTAVTEIAVINYFDNVA